MFDDGGARMEQDDKRPRHKIFDSVFTCLFGTERYMRELYAVLCRRDAAMSTGALSARCGQR